MQVEHDIRRFAKLSEIKKIKIQRRLQLNIPAFMEKEHEDSMEISESPF